MTKKPTKPTYSLCMRSKPDWAAVSYNDQFGYGVYSWHRTKEEAEHNAAYVDGKAVPVDYLNGELIIPPLAEAVGT